MRLTSFDLFAQNRPKAQFTCKWNKLPTSLQSKHNFCERVSSIFFMKTKAAIFDFDGSRRLRRATMYKGMNDDQREREGGGRGNRDYRPLPPPSTITLNKRIHDCEHATLTRLIRRSYCRLLPNQSALFFWIKLEILCSTKALFSAQLKWYSPSSLSAVFLLM